MPKVTFVTPSGDEKVAEYAENENLMAIAVENQVEGILGDCGGVASCATCHVHIDPEWMEKAGPATDVELGMLELEDKTTECSRLGCQVILSNEMDGMIVKVVGQ